MDLGGTLVATVGSLLGVVVGGLLSERGQGRAWRRQERTLSRGERREVYSRFAVAGRSWQSAVLNPDAVFKTTGTHRGIPYTDAGPAYDEAIRALAEVRLVAASDRTIQAAINWELALRRLSEARAAAAPDPTPRDAVATCYQAENAFHATARAELATAD